MEANFAFYPLGYWKVLITLLLNSSESGPSLKIKKTMNYQNQCLSSSDNFYLSECLLACVLISMR
jgi:hypothetical protein